MRQLARYFNYETPQARRPGSGPQSVRLAVRLAVRMGYACALGLWCCVALVGCSEPSDRRALEGTVTLDGQPLAAGGINFFPLSGTHGPTAGGKIVEGRFYVAPEGGTMPGTFRVVITASRKTGKQIVDPTAAMMDPQAESEMVDDYEQYIPKRYNQQSELTAEVTTDGPNQFDFPLSSKR